MRDDLAARHEASLVLSGGATPGDCYSALSEKRLEWDKVTLVPSDERWVAPDLADSNERLIRAQLMRGRTDSWARPNCSDGTNRTPLWSGLWMRQHPAGWRDFACKAVLELVGLMLAPIAATC